MAQATIDVGGLSYSEVQEAIDTAVKLKSMTRQEIQARIIKLLKECTLRNETDKESEKV